MKKNKKPEPLFVKKKITLKELNVDIYKILEHFKFLLPFLNSLLKRYRLYYPGDSGECTALAAGCLLKIYCVLAAVFMALFGMNPSIYTFLLAVFFSYVFSSEIINSSHIKVEIRFLKAFDVFLGNNRHNYYKFGSVRDALVFAETDADPIIKGHIRETVRCLSSPDSTSIIEEYVNSGYHKYLKLFLTLAKLVDENGDISDEKGSVFLNSCIRIKYDVEEDLRFLTERQHRFSGLILTVSLPALSIPFIAMWGVSTIPSLKLFYYGYVGAIAKLLLLVISLLGYKALKRLKYENLPDKKKLILSQKLLKINVFERLTDIGLKVSGKRRMQNERTIKRLGESYTIKNFYMQKLIYFFAAFMIMIVTLSIGHLESRRIYKNDIDDLEEIITVTDTRQIAALKRLIPELTSEIIDNDTMPTREQIKERLLADRDIKAEKTASEAADEIIKRVALYRKEIFGAGDVVLVFIFSFMAMAIPNLSLNFKKALIGSRMQDEVMQFQSIIHMLKEIPGISAVSLLEEMELFSDIFKPAIRQCINEYSISDEGALSRLYEGEKYPGFRRIVDCFMMADELGLSDAFEEISAEIENFAENRKLERKITLDSEGMLGAVISVLPGGIILFGYLLCPFLIRSMQIFNEYQAGINMM